MQRVFYFSSLVLAFIYVLTTYIANGVIVDSHWNSLALAAFTVVSLIYNVFVSRRSLFTKHTRWLLLFTCLSALLYLISPQQDIIPLRNILIVLIVSSLFQGVVSDDRSFLIIAFSYAIASFVGCIYYYFSGLMIVDQYSRFGEEMSGNSNVFAYMTLVSSLFDIWLFFYGSKKIVLRILIAFFFLFNVYTLALSGGRSSFVIPFIFLYCMILQYNGINKIKIVFYTTLFIFGAWFILEFLINSPILYYTIGYRLEGFVHSDMANAAVSSSDQGRDLYRIIALKGWLKSPIWGHGLDSFRFINSGTYSHCNFTELLYNGGLLFFLTFYSFYYTIIKRCKVDCEIQDKYKSFAVSTIISLLFFEIAIVTYDVLPMHILLAVAYSGLNIKKSEMHN